MGFPRQEPWSGLPFPSPVDLPNPGIEPGSPAMQADSLPSEPQEAKEPVEVSFKYSKFSPHPSVCMHACMLSCFSHVQFSETLRTIAHRAPLSLQVSRQEYWTGLPCSPPGDLPNPGIHWG